MRGLVIEVKDSAGSGIGGFYRRASGPLTFDQIVVNREYLQQVPAKGGPLEGRGSTTVSSSTNWSTSCEPETQSATGRRRGHRTTKT